MERENKKAYFNYEIIKEYDAGIVLSGAEVKAIRKGHVNITASYGKVMNKEIYLIGDIITDPSVETKKRKKLLLNKKEIEEIEANLWAKRLTLVPLLLYNSKGLIKLKIALAKHKKLINKKQIIKNRDLDREARREIKNSY